MSVKPIRILGIDPGSRVTGFGVIDVYGREHQYVASGCIKTPPAAPLPERIAVITRHLNEVVRLYRPVQAAVEQVFVNVNPAATLMLGQARGAALAALVMHDLPVFEYTALQVKQAVVGKGKAAKEQVQHMVVQMLALSGTPQSDAADGLAVALTHALRNHSLAAQLQQGGLNVKRGRFQP
ncbi:crossover junction endodeoxyribonuclease RuvC [Neisseria arctica]|uniref:Crossover junction endodeoxyribonuclease RuvC n=1 Tax=Neisseria arctica TaxID=1470200 RepID=A0A0J0YQ84_9NEIS|nr:crossover junction endodeoxyribonuclease RuvC [Neisseria arctica]KLT72295.1 crossover junction endodeoxyribonuclease RuvC [Neisseria arctica]UOO86637.1 crossover junction endodeoxyribonuclease RuvC [Neisseria arctica]